MGVEREASTWAAASAGLSKVLLGPNGLHFTKVNFELHSVSTLRHIE